MDLVDGSGPNDLCTRRLIPYRLHTECSHDRSCTSRRHCRPQVGSLVLCGIFDSCTEKSTDWSLFSHGRHEEFRIEDSFARPSLDAHECELCVGTLDPTTASTAFAVVSCRVVHGSIFSRWGGMVETTVGMGGRTVRPGPMKSRFKWDVGLTFHPCGTSVSFQSPPCAVSNRRGEDGGTQVPNPSQRTLLWTRASSWTHARVPVRVSKHGSFVRSSVGCARCCVCVVPSHVSTAMAIASSTTHVPSHSPNQTRFGSQSNPSQFPNQTEIDRWELEKEAAPNPWLRVIVCE